MWKEFRSASTVTLLYERPTSTSTSEREFT
jgi:hypothetical protein